MFKNVIEKITTQISTMGIVAFVFDLLFCLCLIGMLIYLFSKYIPRRYIIGATILFVLLYLVGYCFDFTFLPKLLELVFVVVSLLGFVYYVPEVKKAKITKISKNSKKYISTEDAKTELIDTLLKTIRHLSERHVGAIITIEKEKSLNTYIDKAVVLDSLVSYELLDTIFFKNTALHDGAVIIRGNRIVCASAFYPSSEKADIPQHYGSRHRAAIGISEQTDAFTIVVSEETGEIATTINGTLSGDVSMETLRSLLEQQVIVRQ
jgi:diadenylate cyclase